MKRHLLAAGRTLAFTAGAHAQTVNILMENVPDTHFVQDLLHAGAGVVVAHGKRCVAVAQVVQVLDDGCEPGQRGSPRQNEARSLAPFLRERNGEQAAMAHDPVTRRTRLAR